LNYVGNLCNIYCYHFETSWEIPVAFMCIKLDAFRALLCLSNTNLTSFEVFS
jgi:hypothetical protein